MREHGVLKRVLLIYRGIRQIDHGEQLPAQALSTSTWARFFKNEEHRRFGASGFTGVVGQSPTSKNALGINDLAQFTPPYPLLMPINAHLVRWTATNGWAPSISSSL
jgi:hypothetical protein